MCMDPGTALIIGSTALSAVKSAMEVVNANIQASQMGKYANQAAAADYAVLNSRAQQLDARATQDAMERQRQALRDRSRIAVASGEAGVGGQTVLRDIYNTMVQADYDRGIIQANKEAGMLDILSQQRAVAAVNKGRINEAKSTSYNPFTAVLKIGGDTASGALAGYSAGNTLFPQAGKSILKSASRLPMPDHYVRGR